MMVAAQVTFPVVFNLLTWLKQLLTISSFLLTTVVLGESSFGRRFMRRPNGLGRPAQWRVRAASDDAALRGSNRAGTTSGDRLPVQAAAGIPAGDHADLLRHGLLHPSWDWPAAVVYLVTWFALVLWAKLVFETAVWDAMWISLNSGRPGYAMLKSLAVLPMIVPLFGIGLNLTKFSRLGAITAGFPYGTVVEIMVVIPLLVIPILFLAFSQQNRRREMQLKEELFAIAQEPVPEASDPRFSKWDARYRFPRTKGLWSV